MEEQVHQEEGHLEEVEEGHPEEEEDHLEEAEVVHHREEPVQISQLPNQMENQWACYQWSLKEIALKLRASFKNSPPTS